VRPGPSRRVALDELRLAAITERCPDPSNLPALAVATRAVLLEDPALRLFTRTPKWDASARRWLSKYRMLLRSAAPSLVAAAEAQAQAFVGERVATYMVQLDRIARADFKHDKDSAAAMRVSHEAIRSALEVVGAVKRPAGGSAVTVALQNNIMSGAATSANQIAADLLLKQHEADLVWARACGRAEALGEPLPPRPRGVRPIRRLEDDAPPADSREPRTHWPDATDADSRSAADGAA
jgi:hypothetical protein